MRSTRKSTLMAGVAAAAAAFAVQAHAQGAAPQQLDEVVVTAQRTETSLQKTPISVTAMSSAVLAQRGSQNLMDLSTFTPNLQIGSRPGSGAAQASFAIRGMGVNANDSSAAVGVYIDDVYFPSNFGNVVGLLDVDRVEVLRGPQGTLFGRNTIAGAIQYVSVKPSKSFGGFLEGTVGNQERRNLSGALNVPLGDQLAIRVSGASNDVGGYVHDDFNNIDRGADRTRIGRVQLRWTPTDKLTIDLKAEASTDKTNGRAVQVASVNPKAQFGGLALLFGEFRPITNAYVSTQKYHVAGFNAPDYFDSDEKTFQGVLTYQLTDAIKFKSITAQVNNSNTIYTDLDMTPLFLLGGTRGNYKDKVFSQEFQFSGASFDNRLKWTAGVYYTDGETSIVGGSNLIGRTNLAFADAVVNKTKSSSIYGQATYNITDKLSATAGLRYSHEQISDKDITAGVSASKSFNDTSPRLGLNYQVSEDLLIYASASKGYRAGGFTLSNFLPAQYNGALAFDPETAWTYELGARAEFFNRRLRVNPTVFFTDWQNIQFNFLIPNPATGQIATPTMNAGNAHIKGAELEMQWAATDRFLVTASASYLDAAYTRVGTLLLRTYPLGYLASLPLPPTFAPAPGSVVDVVNLTKSTPLQQAPKYKFAIGGRYTQPLSGGAKLIGSLDYGWVDKQRSAVTISDGLPMPAYGLLNGRIQYQSPDNHWSVALYGTNLLNKYYLLGGAGFGQGYTVGLDEVDPGRPREYGVTLRASF